MSRLIAFAAALLSFAIAFGNNPKRVACIGNSITYGSCIDDRENQSYPAQLSRMLGKDYQVANFGNPGTTLLRHGHKPYMEQPEFAAALAFRPDIAVIHLGVNDTDPRDWPDYGDNFITDYNALIDSLRAANPDVRIILANLSPLSATHHRFRSGTQVWREIIRERIVDVAAINGAELIDFALPLRDRQDLIVDGIHPGATGAGLLARTAANAITGNYGGLRLADIYSDGIVFQRRKPIRFKGTANAGSAVIVTMATDTGVQQQSAIATDTGEWEICLPPMEATENVSFIVTDGSKTIEIADAAIGEVWLASGQSNMAFGLCEASTFDANSPDLANPRLRLFDMRPVAETSNRTWTDAEMNAIDTLGYFTKPMWRRSDAESARRFSAIAWYFGKELSDSLDVPVGIVANAVGGSGTEAWIDVETLERDMPEVLVNWRKNDYVMPWAQQRANTNTGDPVQTGVKHRHPYEPAYLYATGMRPLENFDFAGTIWYQGESNAHNMEVHEKLFESLVKSLRSTPAHKGMPILFVQLSSLSRPSWPAFRNSQRLLAERIDNTHMVVSHDCGDSLDVHPKNKLPVAHRLAAQALRNVYDRNDIIADSPTPICATVNDKGNIVITWKSGQGLTTADGKAPITFEIAEHDGLYFPASARIDGETIVLTCDKIKNPRFVRYGWQPFTRANLVNAAGFPASTFKIGICR